MRALDGERRAVELHRRRFGTEPELVVTAPGRVNIIGEHTDYNAGYALPAALPHSVWMAVSTRSDERIELVSEGFGEFASGLPLDGSPSGHWYDHVVGTLLVAHEAGWPTRGWRAAMSSDVPDGAGLSSSAAVEVAVLTLVEALDDSGRARIDPLEAARMGQRVENEFLGLPSGLMDQWASAAGQQGCALLIDFDRLSLTPVPLPAGVELVVLDTMTRRELVGSAYADRRAACERVATRLEVSHLRHATPAMLAAADGLDPGDRARARHVLTENERVLALVEAMAADDRSAMGRIMAAGHASLAGDFEVSSPALDAMVEAATAAPGCIGARMTGGGFAGCAVALVDGERVEEFAASVARLYLDAGGVRGAVHPAPASAGRRARWIGS